MKKILSAIGVMIMSAVVMLGLVSCTPFSIDKYLEKVSTTKNFTMEYKWNLMGNISRDVYEFDDDKLRRLNSTEIVSARNSDGEYDFYYYMYNVWFKDRTVDEETYLNLIGLGADGGGLGDEFEGSSKQKGINWSNTILTLATESLTDSFEMGANSFTLKKELYPDVFGSKYDGDATIDLALYGGKIILTVQNGSEGYVMTISKLGSTKVSVSKEMKEAPERYTR